MTATQGVVTACVDPVALSHIGPAWVQSLHDLGILYARIVVSADNHNVLPLPLYRATIPLLTSSGINVSAVFPLSFNRPWLEATPRLFYPNSALGEYNGNLRENRWIIDTCRRLGEVAEALSPLGVETFCPAVESNLLGSIPVEKNIPPANTDKAPALAPEVWASYCYEAYGWLTKAGAKRVELGALSWIAGSGADAANPYCGGYVRAGLRYLRQTGVAKLPFQSLSINAEGNWSGPMATQMRAAITHALTISGYEDLPLTVGEWGVRSDHMKPADAAMTYAALSAVADRMFFFQHPIRTPNDLGDYGLIDWTVGGNGQIVPTAQHTAWYNELSTLLHPIPAPAVR